MKILLKERQTSLPKKDQPIRLSKNRRYYLTQDIRLWIREQLSQGEDKNSIFKHLQNYNFDPGLVALELGGLSELSLEPDQVSELSDTIFSSWSDVPFIDPNFSPRAWKVDSPFLQLYEIPNFLNKDECSEIIETINKKLYDSTVTTGAKGFRTSRTSQVSDINPVLCKKLDEKISNLVGVHPSLSDKLEGLRYDPGQFFKAHHDWFKKGASYYDFQTKIGGQRTWTVMIFLNQVEEGGETLFNSINKIFYPSRGTAICWNNLYEDGRPNEYTMHEALPVISGVKYVITKWFRENPGLNIYTKKKMNKLRETGTLWQLDQNRKIVNPKKNNIVPDLTKKITKIIVEQLVVFFPNFKKQIHSIYVRGSCAFNEPTEGFDIDLILVFHDNVDIQTYSFLSGIFCTDTKTITSAYEVLYIEQKIREQINSNILIDFSFRNVTQFTEDTYYRFCSKFIEGTEDLSVNYFFVDTFRHIKNTLEYATNDGEYTHNLILQRVGELVDMFSQADTIEKNIKNSTLLSLVKVFFRAHSIPFLLKQNAFSQDVYQCYKILVESFPDYEKDLLDIFEIILTINDDMPSSYHEEKINKMIKMSATIAQCPASVYKII